MRLGVKRAMGELDAGVVGDDFIPDRLDQISAVVTIPRVISLHALYKEKIECSLTNRSQANFPRGIKVELYGMLYIYTYVAL